MSPTHICDCAYFCCAKVFTQWVYFPYYLLRKWFLHNLFIQLLRNLRHIGWTHASPICLALYRNCVNRLCNKHSLLVKVWIPLTDLMVWWETAQVFGVYPYVTLVQYNPITSCVYGIYHRYLKKQKKTKKKNKKKKKILGILEDKEKVNLFVLTLEQTKDKIQQKQNRLH